ncbi:MAG: FAD-binding protein [Lachnospiraceae bacterium]|nr:FAD-binding protein [Lachnospiraceae bacterium]
MNDILIIGSGIAGMTCAVKCAELGMHATLVSPFPSERSQSVMAAGGINAVLPDADEADTVAFHIEDTLKGGGYIAGDAAVTGLCESAAGIIKYLEKIGTVFSVDENGRPVKRAFGGQSHKRTYYCGSSTGKQIVSALVMETRRYEAAGLITRKLHGCFHSALIKDGQCYGALIFDESTGGIKAVTADALVLATGGQNALFGKTTGSTACDGYAAGRLLMQGAELKNLEFIQYHPTTLETYGKRMLISEAVRGEGGRLFYEENGRRIYFMEEKYGDKGNLMTRDIVSREIYACKKDVFLDISFLDENIIKKRLPEVRDLCLKYRSMDICKTPIPVAPSVHFFMGGLAVRLNHETNIKNLFAVGECASIYHGANRLGGNSLLAAMHGGIVAAQALAGREAVKTRPSFESFAKDEKDKFLKTFESESTFPVMYVRESLADTMNGHLGIVRDEEGLLKGISDVDYLRSVSEKLKYDKSVLPYFNYSLTGILTLARAVFECAIFRKESRGAHFRKDHPSPEKTYAAATIVSYDGKSFKTRLDKEGRYES